MTSRRASMPDSSSSGRFRFSPLTDSWSFRPRGVHAGSWIMIGPVWVRLGSRESWAVEDAQQMLKPLKPARKRRQGLLPGAQG